MNEKLLNPSIPHLLYAITLSVKLGLKLFKLKASPGINVNGYVQTACRLPVLKKKKENE